MQLYVGIYRPEMSHTAKVSIRDSIRGAHLIEAQSITIGFSYVVGPMVSFDPPSPNRFLGDYVPAGRCARLAVLATA